MLLELIVLCFKINVIYLVLSYLVIMFLWRFKRHMLSFNINERWIGYRIDGNDMVRHVYICLVPCFVIFYQRHLKK